MMMYEVVDYSKTEIATVYIVIISAGLLLYPIARLAFTALSRGTEKWR
ncbi:hypothetical protein JOE23_003532 [Amphibacillus cookii]|nr:hypothetical protein [Amphibacillus cookii]